jgi:hypothetical protein
MIMGGREREREVRRSLLDMKGYEKRLKAIACDIIHLGIQLALIEDHDDGRERE